MKKKKILARDIHELIKFYFAEIPNILDSTQLKMLLKWKGDLKFLPNFKFRRFVKKQTNEKQKVSQNTITDISNTQEETSKADKSLADEKMEAMES